MSTFCLVFVIRVVISLTIMNWDLGGIERKIVGFSYCNAKLGYDLVETASSMTATFKLVSTAKTMDFLPPTPTFLVLFYFIGFFPRLVSYLDLH